MGTIGILNRDCTLSVIRQLCTRADRPLLCQRCSKILAGSNFHTSTQLQGKFEPDGARYGPEIPEYEKLNIQMKSYDFVALEAFEKLAHRMTQLLSIKSDKYMSPASTWDVKVYRPFSTVVSNEYNLNKYERTLQVFDVPNTKLQIFIEYLRLNTPQGVEVTVKPFDEAEWKDRFVEDLNVKALEEHIARIEKERDERKRRS